LRNADYMKSQRLEEILGIIIIESVPVVIGATLSSVGRVFSFPELILAPVLIDVISGINLEEPNYFGKYLWNNTKYAFGASLPYIDKFPEFCKYFEGVM